jgi:septal ring factor EnvC (AmiA/AmiB activator)
MIVKRMWCNQCGQRTQVNRTTGICLECGSLALSKLDPARASVERLRQEIDKLERERHHCRKRLVQLNKDILALERAIKAKEVIL